MNKIIALLNVICIVATLCFFALMVVMVGGHIAGLVMLNGAFASGTTALLRPIAGGIAAVAAITAFVLSYLRKLK